MTEPRELAILILTLIGKHPTINNTYSLERFFAKSDILPDKLFAKIDELVNQEYITIREVKHTINYYQLLPKGENALGAYAIFDFLEAFTNEIDKTGFISNMVFLLDNKQNLVDISDSFKLSDDRLIAFIKSDHGKLDEFTILEDSRRRKWKIRGYIQAHGSIEGYEIIRQQEADNTFQYQLEGIGHSEKPTKGDRLKYFKRAC